MIRAIPAIVAAEPDPLYVVLGATNPNVVMTEEETYRDRFKALAVALGVDANVALIDALVERDELLEDLQATNVYVISHTNPAQITSGTITRSAWVRQSYRHPIFTPRNFGWRTRHTG